MGIARERALKHPFSLPFTHHYHSVEMRIARERALLCNTSNSLSVTSKPKFFSSIELRPIIYADRLVYDNYIHRRSG